MRLVSKHKRTSDGEDEASRHEGRKGARLDETEPLQDAIDKLSQYERKDFSERMVLVGASPFCKVPIFQRKPSTADTKGEQIVNRLKKQELTEKEEKTVFPVLKQWCQKQPLSVWMSRSLPVDMNLPVTSRCSLPRTLQALVLCVGRPAIMLSLYTPLDTNSEYETASTSKMRRFEITKELDPDKFSVQDTEAISSRSASSLPKTRTPALEFEELRMFTFDTSRRLTAHLLDFCHCDFVLLPCVLEYESFTVEKLQAAVDRQSSASRVWFGAPMELTASDYDSMTMAAEAIVSVSYVPCLLEEAPKDHKVKDYPWLLRLDNPWRDLLTLLIERVGGCDLQLTFAEATEFKVKVSLLEAARRLSFRERVVLITMDKRIISCEEALKTYTGKEHSPQMKLRIVEKEPPVTDPDALRIYMDSSAPAPTPADSSSGMFLFF